MNKDSSVLALQQLFSVVPFSNIRQRCCSSGCKTWWMHLSRSITIHWKYVSGLMGSDSMEQLYPVESHSVPAGRSNQFAHQNQWFRFNLFFSCRFYTPSPVWLSGLHYTATTAATQDKIRGVLYCCSQPFYQEREGIRVTVCGLELCFLTECFLNVFSHSNSEVQLPGYVRMSSHSTAPAVA